MLFALVDTSTPTVPRLFDIGAATFTVTPPLAWKSAPDGATILTHQWDGTNVVARSVPLPGATLWYVLKSNIRARLRAVGLEAAADSARITMPTSAQQEWAEALYALNDNPDLIAFLTAIGADPTVILAIDPDATAIFGVRQS